MKKWLLIGLMLCACNDVPPETAARTYMTSLGMPVKGVACTGVDTDGDGYVTCSVTLVGEDTSAVHSIQCAALSGNASGCKETPFYKK